MNISPWLVYMFIKLDALIGIGIAFSVMAGVIAVIYLVGWLISFDALSDLEEKRPMIRTGIKFWATIFTILVIITNALPSTKEMSVIYVVPKIANSEFVNETLPAEMAEIYSMAKEWMKSTLKPDTSKVEKNK